MAKEIICLDSSVLIDYFRKRNKEQTLFYKLSTHGHKFSVTSISQFEILRGNTALQSKFWEEVFARMDTLTFDDDTAIIAAEISQQLKISKKLVAVPDILIAACVIQHNHLLATLDHKDFINIPNLRLLS